MVEVVAELWQRYTATIRALQYVIRLYMGNGIIVFIIYSQNESWHSGGVRDMRFSSTKTARRVSAAVRILWGGNQIYKDWCLVSSMIDQDKNCYLVSYIHNQQTHSSVLA